MRVGRLATIAVAVCLVAGVGPAVIQETAIADPSGVLAPPAGAAAQPVSEPVPNMGASQSGVFTPFTHAYANPAGSGAIMESYQEPHWFQAADGSWKPIDLSLVRGVVGWAAKASAPGPLLAPLLGAAGVVTVPSSAGPVVLAHLDGLGVGGVASATAPVVTYLNGLSGGGV